MIKVGYTTKNGRNVIPGETYSGTAQIKDKGNFKILVADKALTEEEREDALGRSTIFRAILRMRTVAIFITQIISLLLLWNVIRNISTLGKMREFYEGVHPMPSDFRNVLLLTVVMLITSVLILIFSFIINKRLAGYHNFALELIWAAAGKNNNDFCNKVGKRTKNGIMVICMHGSAEYAKAEAICNADTYYKLISGESVPYTINFSSMFKPVVTLGE